MSKFRYNTEHRANQGLCRLFDRSKITLNQLVHAKVLKSGNEFVIETGTQYDNVNPWSQ